MGSRANGGVTLSRGGVRNRVGRGAPSLTPLIGGLTGRRVAPSLSQAGLLASMIATRRSLRFVQVSASSIRDPASAVGISIGRQAGKGISAATTPAVSPRVNHELTSVDDATLQAP